MATLICVDKENGEPGTRVAMGYLKFNTRFGKTFTAPSALPKASRKALGTVKRATEKSVKTNGPSKQKQPSFSVRKMTEKTVKKKKIEKFFPFNPLDFESFDLPEERQIAHLPLSGVPLMILDEEGELEKLFQLGPPSPVKMPSPPWECNLLQSPSSILLTLDVELPVVCYDIDI
uniref:Pituitary tumor-transforming 2 n=1 Tax=Cercocebus atys TaxID=9531 RepID=A0A2K5NDS9_CERAT